MIEIWSPKFFPLLISPTRESIWDNDRVTGQVDWLELTSTNQIPLKNNSKWYHFEKKKKKIGK